jgi:hypothetical protein
VQAWQASSYVNGWCVMVLLKQPALGSQRGLGLPDSMATLMPVWYVIVDAEGLYMPLLGGDRPWVEDLHGAEVFTGLGYAKNALKHYVHKRPGCRVERIPRLPDRVRRR